MDYQTNLSSYRVHFRAEATVSAENEAEDIEQLKELSVDDCENFSLTYTFSSSD